MYPCCHFFGAIRRLMSSAPIGPVPGSSIRWVRSRDAVRAAASVLDDDYRPGFLRQAGTCGQCFRRWRWSRAWWTRWRRFRWRRPAHRRCARIVAALALGAQAAVLGTRFLATFERTRTPSIRTGCSPHRKRTRYTRFCSVTAAQRAASHAADEFVEEWLPNVAPRPGKRPDEPVIGHTRVADTIFRYRGSWAFPPSSGGPPATSNP